MNKKYVLLAAVCVPGLALGGLVASPALAAQTPQTLQCDGHQVTVATNTNNSSDHGGWSAATIISGGSGVLVPTAFSGSFYDETTSTQLFSFTQVKGYGNGNHNQPTITCVQTTTSTLGEAIDPGEELPPGTSADDVVTMTITVTAVQHS